MIEQLANSIFTQIWQLDVQLYLVQGAIPDTWYNTCYKVQYLLQGTIPGTGYNTWYRVQFGTLV